MIELLDEELRSFSRQSSKGNQLKGCKDGKWYKADYAGYEGLAEYVISAFLKFSSLEEDEFVRYELSNLIPMCKHCNKQKESRIVEEGELAFLEPF